MSRAAAFFLLSLITKDRVFSLPRRKGRHLVSLRARWFLTGSYRLSDRYCHALRLTSRRDEYRLDLEMVQRVRVITTIILSGIFRSRHPERCSAVSIYRCKLLNPCSAPARSCFLFQRNILLLITRTPWLSVFSLF